MILQRWCRQCSWLLCKFSKFISFFFETVSISKITGLSSSEVISSCIYGFNRIVVPRYPSILTFNHYGGKKFNLHFLKVTWSNTDEFTNIKVIGALKSVLLKSYPPPAKWFICLSLRKCKRFSEVAGCPYLMYSDFVQSVTSFLKSMFSLNDLLKTFPVSQFHEG